MTKKNEEWLKTLQMEEFSYLTNLLGFFLACGVWGLKGKWPVWGASALKP
jgi:hypothetical protein